MKKKTLKLRDFKQGSLPGPHPGTQKLGPNPIKPFSQSHFLVTLLQNNPSPQSASNLQFCPRAAPEQKKNYKIILKNYKTLQLALNFFI